MEFRDHDHIIEIVVFAPAVALPQLGNWLASESCVSASRLCLNNQLIN